MTCSKTLVERAQAVIPGGVNSPVRAFGAVGGEPLFFEKGEKAFLITKDGKRYLDYIGSWGPLIHGHAHPHIISKVESTIKKGLSFGTATELEIELAELICQLIPSIEMIRMVNSGTEATMTAIRLARGFTNRDKIIKFEGCYHGHNDALLVKGGSGLLTFGLPSSAGVPADFVKHTLTAPFNDLESVKQLFQQHGQDIAGVIVEPVAGNMGCIPPVDGFLKGLRELCDQHKSLLIFDEVMTGFRVDIAGAQAYYNITPDLTTLGKVIGGGMPVGAIGGPTAIMEHLAPLGPVYQAGTLSGNPIAMAAGIATLELLQEPYFYETLNAKTKRLVDGIQTRAKGVNLPMICNHRGSMFGFFFSDKPIHTLSDISDSHVQHYKQFFHYLLEKRIYFAPSAYEAAFMSNAHTEHDIDITLDAIEYSFHQLTNH